MPPSPRAAIAAATLALAASVHAHSGPPYPVVSNQRAGAYVISLWADPDTTEDGSAAGQFWVMMTRADNGEAPPGGTRVTVTATPLDRRGSAHIAGAAPVRGNIGNQFAAVVLDHEGRFAVHVTVDGPLGPAALEGAVDATYDLRPAPLMLAWYLVPFLLIGFLWTKLLIRRRATGPAPPSGR
jgi:hypothetical protein